MSDFTITKEQHQRPRRADAQRNYDKLVAVARDAYTAGEENISLEEIARRAGVGIGTLYRNFPERRNLIEAIYVDEVNALSRSAQDVDGLEPWEALTTWLQRFVEYVGTKQALAEELFAVGSAVFDHCRTELYGSGEPLLARAQASGIVRDDITIVDLLQLVAGIAKMQLPDPSRRGHLVQVALDGLRVIPDRG